MGKKILFAVMALLVMATGKIWAQDTAEKKAYAVLYQNTEKGIGSLYFMYTNKDVIPTAKTVEIPNGGSSDGTTITLTKTKDWEVPTGEISDMSDNWTKNNGITQVVFEDSFKDFEVRDCSKWFYDFKNLTDIKGIENLNTSKVTYMVSMFDGCSSLTSLDLSSFNTSGAANTASMFRNCSSLKQITFGNNFKTSNTESMFQGCSSLTSLNLSSFNTSMVQNMNQMFSGCSGLTTLTLGSFDMSKMESAEYFRNMFYGCNKSNITINGNALVFVTSDAQKNIWEGITGVNLMVKKDGEDKYVSDGTVDITLDNDKDTPVIFPHDFTANSVTFTRKFTAGKPHTICLPFAITNTADYGTFYKLSSYDKDNRRVKFTKVDATEANTPYLFIPKTDGVTTINVTGDDAGVAILT